MFEARCKELKLGGLRVVPKSKLRPITIARSHERIDRSAHALCPSHATDLRAVVPVNLRLAHRVVVWVLVVCLQVNAGLVGRVEGPLTASSPSAAAASAASLLAMLCCC